ncbi:MAG: hypothetical protein WCB31_07515 [Nitrososphaeraceae archaeon]
MEQNFIKKNIFPIDRLSPSGVKIGSILLIQVTFLTLSFMSQTEAWSMTTGDCGYSEDNPPIKLYNPPGTVACECPPGTDKAPYISYNTCNYDNSGSNQVNNNNNQFYSNQVISDEDCLSYSHLRLKQASWSETLFQYPVTIQSPQNDPNNPLKYDEYSMKITKMPPGITPEQFLYEMMAESPNSVANSFEFNLINAFTKRSGGSTPTVGDIYDIDFLGPDNGSVMLVEMTDSYFIFQTVETPETGQHPESGAREIGFEKNFDGSVTFYTRGVSQANVEVLGNDAAEIDVGGSQLQHKSWTAFFKGINDEINRLGGNSQIGTFHNKVVKLPYNQDPSKNICNFDLEEVPVYSSDQQQLDSSQNLYAQNLDNDAADESYLNQFELDEGEPDSSISTSGDDDSMQQSLADAAAPAPSSGFQAPSADPAAPAPSSGIQAPSVVEQFDNRE